jgi:hypothetical protein
MPFISDAQAATATTKNDKMIEKRRQQTASNRQSLRNVKTFRKLEDTWDNNGGDDNYNDDNNHYDNQNQKQQQTSNGGSKSTTLYGMFSNAPNQWTPLQWVWFTIMLLIFGICFFCWCLMCFIPRYFGQKGTLMYSAMLV